jgi:hypothetical protein
MEEQQFNFKPFEGKNTKATEYFISVTKAFGFGLSADFCKKHQILSNFDFAKILYDKSKNTVGFKFFTKDDKDRGGSFAITKGKHSASIMAQSWFKDKSNNINPADYADKYDVNEYNDPNFGRIFYIKLAKKENLNE